LLQCSLYGKNNQHAFIISETNFSPLYADDSHIIICVNLQELSTCNNGSVRV